MTDSYVVKQEIRNDYQSIYYHGARARHPRRDKWSGRLRTGGVFSLLTGVAGLITAGVTAFFSGPLALLILGIGVAGTAGGTAAFFAGEHLDKPIQKDGDAALEKDIDSLKLVKKYLTESLPRQAESQKAKHAGKETQYRDALSRLDLQESHLRDMRAAALALVRSGLSQLQEEVGAARKELDFFRNEVKTALGDEFGATAQKRQPEPVAVVQRQQGRHPEGAKFIYRPMGDYDPTGR